LTFFNELKRRNVFRVGIAYVIAAWLILQVVGVLQDILTLPEWAGKFVLTLLIVGLPLALIFAWAFELTPDGVKRESEVDRSESIRPKTGKRLDRVIIGVLVVALAYIGFDKLILEPSQDAELVEATRQAVAEEEVEQSVESAAPSDLSIAVLPFVNLSSDPEQEYFSDGISEELLNLLAKIPELRVTSRTSAFSFKGTDLKITEVAHQLRVAHILEGSVRKAGNQLRITAQLIEAESDIHLWSETYDRKLDNIFAIQDEIAVAVVAQLKVELLGEVSKFQTADPAAYDLLLQARELVWQYTPEAYKAAIPIIREALEVDPDFAAAWAELAMAYADQITEFHLRMTDDPVQRAREAALRALSIDPDNAMALTAIAQVIFLGDYDPATAARYFEMAVMLEPSNYNIVITAAGFLAFIGQLERANEMARYLVSRDPAWPFGHGFLGQVTLDPDAAIESFKAALRLDSQFEGANGGIGWAHIEKGEYEAALQAFEREPLDASRLQGLWRTHYYLDNTLASEAAFSELVSNYERELSASIALSFAWEGDIDRAFHWLDKALQNKDPGLIGIIGADRLSPLYDDARWQAFLERAGISLAQFEAVEFNVTLPE